ncbi:hypothetical protein Pfo_027337 [Paulownia fortunei]|nr:hypothetical protein Pfo_027337 [Paulownia fortunei]
MDHLRTNYSYWKAKMRAFIKSVDERAWPAIVIGWEHSPKDQWNIEDEKVAIYNSKALNVIFSSIDVNQFKLIATYESAKEAWEILQTSYEGTAAVRISKMMNNHRVHVATNQRYVLAVQYNATCLTSSTATGEKDMQILDSETNSDDDEPSIEEIQQMYNKIFQKWLEICKINKSLEKQIVELNKEKESVKVEILKFINLVAKNDQKIHEIEQELLHT